MAWPGGMLCTASVPAGLRCVLSARSSQRPGIMPRVAPKLTPPMPGMPVMPPINPPKAPMSGMSSMPAMEIVATSIQYCATGGLTTWVCARPPLLTSSAAAPSMILLAPDRCLADGLRVRVMRCLH